MKYEKSVCRILKEVIRKHPYKVLSVPFKYFLRSHSVSILPVFSFIDVWDLT